MRQGLTYSEAGKLGSIISAEIARHQKQERIEVWNANPKLCAYCSSPISYDKRTNDYCSHGCSAKADHLRKGRKLASPDGLNQGICLFCSSPFHYKGDGTHKYCSRDCMSKFWWQESKKELLFNNCDTSSNHKVAKRYLIELHNGACQICGLDCWNGQPMPLVLDHINGNSGDGSLTNLRVICNNCDALTDTYKSKNKGNGRVVRRQRYRDGKSY